MGNRYGDSDHFPPCKACGHGEAGRSDGLCDSCEWWTRPQNMMSFGHPNGGGYMLTDTRMVDLGP